MTRTGDGLMSSSPQRPLYLGSIHLLLPQTADMIHKRPEYFLFASLQIVLQV